MTNGQVKGSCNHIPEVVKTRGLTGWGEIGEVNKKTTFRKRENRGKKGIRRTPKKGGLAP